jgi:RHS repeat-associated protein
MTKSRLLILPVLLGGAVLHGYTGSLTTINCGSIGGSASGAPQVDIYDGTPYLTSVYVTAGVFGLQPLPPALLDNQIHSISARYSGTDIALPIGNSTTQFAATLQCTPTSTGYQYYYTESFLNFNSAKWNENSVSSGNIVPYQGLVIGPSANGSLISNTQNVPVQGPNATDYEVNSTLTLQANGGTYVQYLRASSNALASGSSGTGTYLAVELQNPSFQNGVCSAYLNVYQSGNPAALISTPVLCRNGMQIRTVVFGNNANIMLNGVVYSLVGNIASCAQGAYCAPGVGGGGMPSGSSISQVELGPWDNLAPGSVDFDSFTSTVNFTAAPGQPGSVMAQWAGALDNPNGVGIAYYQVSRSAGTTDPNTANFTSYDASFYDGTVLVGNTYTYTITPYDFHGNAGPATLELASTSAGTVDGRRVGQHTTGSYWGGAGEQIDLMSGNLNFTLPLITAIGRGGLKATFALAYNSQNWRVVTGYPRILSADTGFGFGWQFMLGSIMPIYTGNGIVAYYLFTDSTGAQYNLTHNNGSNVWSSTASVYVWYDANANVLHFRNGTFWVMGCTSAGGEQDAGSLYPTIVEDSNGNQIIITYMAGAGVSWSNSSSRITMIEDARAVLDTCQTGGGEWVPCSYTISYTPATQTTPAYLSGITSHVNTAENYTITVQPGQGLWAPPPAAYAFASFGTTGLLQTVQSASLGYAWSFNYDTFTSDGDLTGVVFPQGGSLNWTHQGFQYAGQRTIRQVYDRTLATTAQQQTAFDYSLTWPDPPNTVPFHSAVTLDDITSGTEKWWNFNPSGSGFPELVSELQYRSAPGVTSPLPRDETYTWSQDSNSNSYLGTVATTLDKGSSYAQTTTTTQTQDGYGNVVTSSVSDYGGQSTRTYSNVYLYQNNSAYKSYYLYDRLATSTLTSMSPNVTLASNVYDGGAVTPTSTLPHEWDSFNYQTAFNYRGNITQANTPGKTTNSYYDYTGTVTSQNDNNGHSVAVTTSTATNYTLPDALTPNATTSLQTQATYSLSFAPASVAPPGQTLNNGASGTAAYTSYDNYGRVAYTLAPAQTSGGTGAQTNYTYGYNSTTGWTITATTTNTGNTTHFTTTMLDGLGRTASVLTGTGSTALSEVDTTYAPCACSPLGKMNQQSQPYDPLTSAPLSTTYTYDALGRTVNVLLADGASSTTYLYQGNVTTVTDPAGKWKQYLNDAFGNLVTVIEPDPAVNPVVPAGPISTNPLPAGYLLTSYTYDQFNHLTQVAMPRNTANGMKTQTRTFTYTSTTYPGKLVLPALWLTSATNPENGTVSYTYNADGTLASKKDAKQNTESYTYDTYGRLVGITLPDQFQTFTYDTCPLTAQGCVSMAGQLMQAFFGSSLGAGVGANALSFEYNYSYTPAGKVASKTLQLQSANHLSFQGAQAYGAVTASYAYDNQGALVSLTYPQQETWVTGGVTTVFNYTLDAMERPTGMTDQNNYVWASNATYNAANQILSDGRQTWTYNALLQIQTVTGSGMSMTYNYQAAANNGQIASSYDATTGETVTYQYDALKRLLQAQGSNWTENYLYDGYGNLTQMNPSGTANGMPSIQLTMAVDANNVPNNRVTGWADANGNQTAGFAGTSLIYDTANHVSQVQANGQNSYYWYDPDNRRIYYKNAGSAETIYFYGADGTKLATYTYAIVTNTMTGGNPEIQLTQQSTNVYFAGRLVTAEGKLVATDRLASVRSGGPGNLGYQAQYPYGVEYTTTANDREKYATYTRDSVSGLDYAANRYYWSQWGRFLSPDPYANSAGLGDPGSWNRYAYTRNDPSNRLDAGGLVDCPAGFVCISDDTPDDPVYGNGAGALSVNSKTGCNEYDPFEKVAGNCVDYQIKPMGGPVRVKLKVTKVQKSGKQYDQVEGFLQAILKSIDQDCLNFLQSGGYSLGDYVSALLSNNLLAVANFSGSIAAFTNTGGTNLAPGTAAIVVNNNGAFFNSGDTVDQGQLRGDTPEADVFILLHELGHALSAENFQNDLNSSAAGAKNDSLIQQHCQSTLNKFK